MADPAVGNNSEIFDPSKEKKKKKKKVLDLDSVLLGSSSTAPLDDGEGSQEPSSGAGGAVGDKGLVSAAGEGGEGEGFGAHDDILESLESFGSKKKKKKVKKVVIDEELVIGEEDTVPLVLGGEEALDFDFSKKKKKKTKGIDEIVAEGDIPIDVVDVDDGGGGGDDDEVVVDVVEEEVVVVETRVVVDKPSPVADEDEIDDDLGGGQDIQFDEDDGGDSPTKENENGAVVPSVKSWLNSDRDYTYDELLTRVFEIMRAKNPEMASGTKQKFVMRPPQVVRIGTKKTSFVNFMEICKMLHRHQKHLLDFLLSELGTSGSIDGNNQLIIKGRFQQKQIENVLRRYIKEYVTCHTCRSPNTLLQKDFRLFFLQCEACGSRCSVASIKHGFQAVTGKRAAMRAKAN